MKQIYCKDCKLFLGEIRDATLRKGIIYRCAACEAAGTPVSWGKPQSNVVPDFFSDLFKAHKS